MEAWEQLIRDVAADELAHSAGALADELAAVIHADLPELGDDPASIADTRASCLANLEIIFLMLRDGTDPAAVQPPADAVAYAHAFVERGLGLPALLRTYRVGHAALWRQWTGALEHHAPDLPTLVEALRVSAERLFTYIDAVSGRLTHIYDTARERWSRSAEAVRVETVRAILEGQAPGTADASARLRYALQRRHLALVVWSDEPGDADQHDALERMAGDLAAGVAEGEPLVLTMGRQVVAAWLPGGDPDAVHDAPLQPAPGGGAARVAVGLPGDGVDGFRRSHEEAMLARRVARLSDRRPGSVTRYGRVALQALASADLDHAREFVVRELGPLGGSDAQALRLTATLRAFYEEGMSPLRTAQRLGVHTNTVGYRLNQARELLGRDLDQRALELQVALALARVVANGNAPE
jgi:DNA-binding PucR family transcriptional regulator